MRSCELLIRGAQLIDGSGACPRAADIAVSHDTILTVDQDLAIEAGRIIDATGKTVAPGFVDIHSHSDLTIFVNPAAESKVRQGVTTEINGQCGFTPFPAHPADYALLDALCPFITEKPDYSWVSTADFLAKLRAARPSINEGQMVGHGALRAWVLGFENRPATPEEIEGIARAAQEALEQGAIGISLGLAYPLGSFAKTDELLAVARVAAGRGALLSAHIRSEGAELVQSLQEMIDIARRVSDAGPLKLQIDHLKASGRRWWGSIDLALETIQQAKAEGLDIAFDVYPYTAGSRHLSGSLPSWVHDGGNEAVMARLQDPDCRRRLREEHEAWLRGESTVSPFELDLQHIVITDVATEANRVTVGKTLQQIGADRGQDPLEAALDMLVEEKGHISIVLFSMSEEDMQKALAHPLGCVGTDGLVFAPYGPLSRGKPHPRCYGTFPRAIGHYARDRAIMSLEEAVRKCTALPASRLGLTDRGRLAEGMKADIVIFDPGTLIDRATYEDPHQYPVGIEYVIVNGKITIEGGRHTEAGAGTVV